MASRIFSVLTVASSVASISFIEAGYHIGAVICSFLIIVLVLTKAAIWP
jgi:hypothetical protein